MTPGPFKGPRGPLKGPRGPFRGPRGPFRGWGGLKINIFRFLADFRPNLAPGPLQTGRARKMVQNAPIWKVSRPPGAAQTPQNRRSPAGQKIIYEKPSCKHKPYPGILLKDTGFLLKDPGVLLKDPGVL